MHSVLMIRGSIFMKLFISKLLSTVLPVIGVLCIFGYAFAGNILYGWVAFVILSLASGMINTIFFRCPHCHKSIPANSTVNQKYCPLCGEDLGMKSSRISYYGKAIRTKKGFLLGYTIVAPMVFIVSLFILFLIVVAVFGVDSLTQGIGRVATVLAFVISVVLAVFCRVAVSSSMKLGDETLYYSRLPFRWKRYEIADIRARAEKLKPFYHVNRGYVFATSEGVTAIPMASYAGGQEIFERLTQLIGTEMPDVRPDLVMSKRSDRAKADEESYARMKEEYESIFGTADSASEKKKKSQKDAERDKK